MPENNRVDGIQSLKLNTKINDFLITLNAPDEFKYLFKMPNNFYSQGSPESPGSWPNFENRKLLPLWEHFEQVFAVDTSDNKTEYLSFYLEAPDEPTIYGTSVFLPIFHMLELHVWEYGGESKEAKEAYEFAKSLGFPRLDVFQALLINHISCTDSQIDVYRDLLETINEQ